MNTARKFWYTVLSGGGGGIDLENSVFLILDIGQSNSAGNATAQRTIQLTTDREIPDDVYIYTKPGGATFGYSLADDGAFTVPQLGTIKYPGQAGGSSNGAVTLLAERLKRVSPNPVYSVMVGRGGTGLEANLTSPDWNEGQTNEMFEIAFNIYYGRAYEDLQALHPTKTIVPVVIWHQGETDATDATARANYASNFSSFVSAWRSLHNLSDALLIINKIYYQPGANEDAINTAFDNYAAANSDLVKLVDISDVPRKVDLTTGEKGGISPYATDDEHTSYLGMIAKAERAYGHIKAKYFPSAQDSIYTLNDRFDPSTLGTTGVRLQLTSGKMTVGANSVISAITNDFSIGDFTTISGSPRYKISGRKGMLSTLVSSNPRIQSSAAIGTSLFADATGFSTSFFWKPRDGQGAEQYIFHDIQNTASPNNSRVAVISATDGTVYCFVAIGGTAKLAQTANVIFNNNSNLKEKHIAIVFPNGGTVRIYIDGVLQSLNATNNGDISALNLANYVNATNPLALLCRKTGASTYDSYAIGSLRELNIHKGVLYTQDDVNNLMLN